jgi:hypothetical protein
VNFVEILGRQELSLVCKATKFRAEGRRLVLQKEILALDITGKEKKIVTQKMRRINNDQV